MTTAIGSYADDCYCSYNFECDTKECVNNVCTFTFPWWGYLIIALGTALIIAVILSLVCCMK